MSYKENRFVWSSEKLKLNLDGFMSNIGISFCCSLVFIAGLFFERIIVFPGFTKLLLIPLFIGVCFIFMLIVFGIDYILTPIITLRLKRRR
jgi:hypothetical protein